MTKITCLLLGHRWHRFCRLCAQARFHDSHEHTTACRRCGRPYDGDYWPQ